VLGTTFGPYRIEELIGHGGMGEVYRAHDTQTERTVALKVLPLHLARDAEYQVRFRRECAAAASLNEPHVVPIHHFGDVDGRLFLDMRLVSGTDLGAWLAAYGPLPPEVAVAVVTQVAQALDAAHAEGLVHRDVKPSNVLLAGVTGREVDITQVFAYLLDFGIARNRDDSPLTAAGQIVGTHRYMAPERYRGSEGDPASDVYALASVLHQMVTGSPPFAGPLPDLMTAHLHQPPPRPSQLRPGVPAGLDEVVATGMAKNPADRYPTAGALAAAARTALGTTSGHFAVPAEGPTETGHRTPPQYPPPPSRPRHEQPPPAAYEPPYPRPEPRPVYPEVAFPPPVPVPNRPPAASRPERTPLVALAVALFLVVAVATGLALTRFDLFGTATPGAPAATTPPSRPATPEDLLLATLPSGFGKGNCRADARARSESGALSYVACGGGPQTGPSAAQFARFGTKALLDKEFNRQADNAGLTVAQGTQSACRGAAAVRSTWSRDGETGSIACLVGKDINNATAAFVLWTDTRTLTFGYVRRDDADPAALYDWWNGARFTS